LGAPDRVCRLVTIAARAVGHGAAVSARRRGLKRAGSVVDDRDPAVRRRRLPALERAVARIEADGVAEVELADGLAAVQLQANAQALLDLAVLGLRAPRREVAQHLGDRRHAAVDLDAQVLAEAAARAGEVPHALHLKAEAAAEAVGLDAPLGDDELVFLQQLAVGDEQLFARDRVCRLAHVVSLNSATRPRMPLTTRNSPTMP